MLLSKKYLWPCKLALKKEPCKPYLRFHSTPYAVTCVIRVRSLTSTSIPLAPCIRDDARLRARGKVVCAYKTSGCKNIAARSSQRCPFCHMPCACDWNVIGTKDKTGNPKSLRKIPKVIAFSAGRISDCILTVDQALRSMVPTPFHLRYSFPRASGTMPSFGREAIFCVM